MFYLLYVVNIYKRVLPFKLFTIDYCYLHTYTCIMN